MQNYPNNIKIKEYIKNNYKEKSLLDTISLWKNKLPLINKNINRKTK